MHIAHNRGEQLVAKYNVPRERLLSMQIKLILSVGWVALFAGCATPLPDPVDAKAVSWVEKDTVVHQLGLKAQKTKALVLAEQLAVTPDPRDRVTWNKKPSTQNQYPNERHGAEAALKLDTDLRAKAFLFETQGKVLSVTGQMALNQFKDDGSTRYFVELFSRDEMNEQGVAEMNAAYQHVLERLKSKGVDPNRIILGGAQYKQPKNGIVLLTVKSYDR